MNAFAYSSVFWLSTCQTECIAKLRLNDYTHREEKMIQLQPVNYHYKLWVLKTWILKQTSPIWWFLCWFSTRNNDDYTIICIRKNYYTKNGRANVTNDLNTIKDFHVKREKKLKPAIEIFVSMLKKMMMKNIILTFLMGGFNVAFDENDNGT